jgi:ABC-type sugar transport system substrate-binding protein
VKSTKIEVVAAASVSAAESAPAPTVPAAKESAPVLVNPYSADGVKQIMEKAREAQKQMNEHTRQQEQM